MRRVCTSLAVFAIRKQKKREEDEEEKVLCYLCSSCVGNERVGFPLTVIILCIKSAFSHSMLHIKCKMSGCLWSAILNVLFVYALDNTFILKVKNLWQCNQKTSFRRRRHRGTNCDGPSSCVKAF